jgi:hypothetical protein
MLLPHDSFLTITSCVATIDRYANVCSHIKPKNRSLQAPWVRFAQSRSMQKVVTSGWSSGVMIASVARLRDVYPANVRSHEAIRSRHLRREAVLETDPVAAETIEAAEGSDRDYSTRSRVAWR